MKSKIENDIIVELHVPDFAIAKDFYSQLGFEVAKEKPVKDRNGYLVMKRSGTILCFYCGCDQVYEQSYFKKFPKNTKRGYAIEIGIPVTKIDEFYSQVEKNLAEFIVQELKMKRWGKKDFRMVDPFGFYLRFTEPYNTLTC